MKTRIAATAAVSLGLVFTGTSIAAAETSEGELALDVLETIEVAEDDYCTDYDRSAYAPNGWVDHNGSGHHTRDDILIRDLDEVTFRDSDGAVDYGISTDPYGGETIEHIIGDSEVDIEHVVAVGQAHRNGACAWDDETKQDFYQDQDNLVAVSSWENQSKSDNDAADWLPPNQGAYCDFAASITFVKDKWDLTMNEAEYAEIQRILSTDDCEGQQAVPAVALTDAEYVPGDSANDAANGSDDDTDTEASGSSDDILPEGVEWWMVIVGAVVVLGVASGAMTKTTARRVTRR